MPDYEDKELINKPFTLFNNDSEPTQLVVTLGTRPTNR